MSSCLGHLLERKSKCKFAKTCTIYSTNSYTCTHLGGGYCGWFRKFLAKEQKEALVVGQ